MIKTKTRNNLFLILFVVIMTILSLLRIMSSLFVPSSAWDGSSAASFNSGTGSANNPYVISTEEELSYFNDLLGSGITFEGMYLSLGNDLDMTGSTWEGKTTEFKGNFNGNGHTITLNSVFINIIGVEGSVSLLNIKRTISLSSEILCITNKGTIEGCIIDGIVDVDETTSGLVCYTNSGTIKNVGVLGSLSGHNSDVSVIAYTNSGLIDNVYTTVEMKLTKSGKYESSNGDAIVYTNSGTINNAYYAYNSSQYGIKVDNDTMKTQEFVEILNENNSSLKSAFTFVENNYPVIITDIKSGIECQLDYSAEDIFIYNTDILETNIINVTNDMPCQFYYTLDGSNPITSDTAILHDGSTIQIEGNGIISMVAYENGYYGVIRRQQYLHLVGDGTEESPYLISSKQDLHALKVNPSAHYDLVVDIEFTDSDYEVDGLFAGGWETLPSFSGVLNGNSHSISNLKGDKGGFVLDNKGIIKFIRFLNTNMSNTAKRGDFGTIAKINSGTISSCYVQMNSVVYGQGNPGVVAGGIAGNNQGSILYCSTEGSFDVHAADVSYNWVSGVGGIAGKNNGTIKNCYNRANISISSSKITEYVYVGGITSSGSVRNCRNENSIYVNVMLDYDVYYGAFSGDYYSGNSNECYGSVKFKFVTSGLNTKTHLSTRNNNCYSSTYLQNSEKRCLESSYPLFDFENNWVMIDGTPVPQGVMNADGNCYTRVSYEEKIDSNGNHIAISKYKNQYGVITTDTYNLSCSCSKDTLKYDKDNHYYECSCGNHFDVEEHNYENYVCSLCGYEKSSEGLEYILLDDGTYEVKTLGSCQDEVVVIPSNYNGIQVTSIGENAFENESNIIKVVLPDTIKYIKSNAFYNCDSVTEVILGENVEVIEESAFECCASLEKIIIPKSVNAISDKAFSNIDNLIVCFEGSAPSFGGSNVFLNTIARVCYPNNDATWTTSVMNGQIGSITWVPYDSDGDIIIDSGKFYTSYGNAYWTLSFSGTLTVSSDNSYLDLPNYTASQRPVWEKYKDRIISVKFVSIDQIGDYTFYGYNALKSVDFGTVTKVCSYAFANCSSLESIFIGNDSDYITICQNAFYACSSLKEVAFPYNTTVEGNAFAGCSQLEKIYITTYSDYGAYPISATSNSFSGVTATVYLPAKWVNIRDYGDFGGNLSWKEAAYGPCGTYAFWMYDEGTSTITITGTGAIQSHSSGTKQPWYGLRTTAKNLIIEDGITLIYEYTFEYMSKIETVRLPNTLQELSCNAFNDCRSMNNLIIPASLTKFSAACYFNRCDVLTDLYYMGTAEEWKKIENNNVVKSSYDNITTIHYLVMKEYGENSCNGIDAYYQFDDTSIYSDCYDLNKQLITKPFIHDYKEVITSPTCTEQGYTTHICNNCGDLYVDTYVKENGHNYIDVVTSPTCMEQGYTTHTCDRCQDSYVDTYVKENGHKYTEWYTVTEAKCTTDGLEQRDCENCDHYETNVLVQLGHKYNEVVTEPTCTEQGYTTYTCERCQDSYVDTYVKENGHMYNDWYTVTEAKCTTDGLEQRDCENCDHYETNVLVQLGHNYNEVVTEPTCTEKGYTTHTCERCQDSYIDTYVKENGHKYSDWYTVTEAKCTTDGLEQRDCENCDHYETNVLEELGHNYNEVVTEPTCTEQGYTTYTCERCQDSYVDTYVKENGHMYNDWYTVTEAKCTTDGLEQRDCENCDHYETNVLEELGHNYNEVVTEPTCTEKGYTTYTCERCQDSYIDTYVKENGHKYTEWYTVTEAKCTTDGLEQRDCENCDHYETNVLVQLGHNYNEVVTKPTCTEQGYTTHTCERCQDSYIDTYVKENGHSFGEWIIIDEATPFEDGLEKHICIECQYEQTRVIAATHQHNYSEEFTIDKEATCTESGEKSKHCTRDNCTSVIEKTIIESYGHNYIETITEPTCTEQGYTTHTCDRCQDSYVDTYVKENGHMYNDWYTVTEAKCTTDGLEQRDCENCDHYETNVLEELGHKYNEVVTEPTCTEKGYTTHTCERCQDSYIDNYQIELSHNYNIYESNQNGTHYKVCSNDSNHKELDKCNFGEWIVVKEVSAFEDGYEKHVCQECNYEETKIIYATHTHDYSTEWTIDKEPTCTEDGIKSHHCTKDDCTYVKDVTIIPSLGHELTYYEEVKATCTESGHNAYEECSVCDYTTYKYEEAHGHKESEWIIDVDSTETEYGKKHTECTVCHEKLNEGKVSLKETTSAGGCTTATNIAHILSLICSLSMAVLFIRKRK